MVGGRPEQAHDERLLVQAAWRVVGAVESPLKNPELSSLVDGVLGPAVRAGLHRRKCTPTRARNHRWMVRNA